MKRSSLQADASLPLTWGSDLPITAACGTQFSEALLFTHRGLSGPAVLQISNYWQAGQALSINLLPECDAAALIENALERHPKQSLKNTLSQHLPKRLVEALFAEDQLQKALNQLGHGERELIAAQINQWQLVMNGTEGYRAAEVTLGGVDTDELSSKDMQSKKVPGLYFIGEVMDVSGHLGGYNFQWAWASGTACGLAC